MLIITIIPSPASTASSSPDVHVRYKLARHWTADIGADNLNNQSYFLYHPFMQRTLIVDMKYSY